MFTVDSKPSIAVGLLVPQTSVMENRALHLQRELVARGFPTTDIQARHGRFLVIDIGASNPGYIWVDQRRTSADRIAFDDKLPPEARGFILAKMVRPQTLLHMSVEMPYLNNVVIDERPATLYIGDAETYPQWKMWLALQMVFNGNDRQTIVVDDTKSSAVTTGEIVAKVIASGKVDAVVYFGGEVDIAKYRLSPVTPKPKSTWFWQKKRRAVETVYVSDRERDQCLTKYVEGFIGCNIFNDPISAHLPYTDWQYLEYIQYCTRGLIEIATTRS